MTKPSKEQITQDLREILTRVSDGRVSDDIEFTGDMSIMDDLGLFSLDLIELAFDIQKRWGVSIGRDEYESLKTIEDVVNFIHDNAGKAGEPSAPQQP